MKTMLTLVLFSTAAFAADLRQRTQRFDADPGWEGYGNLVKVKPIPVLQAFGFSKTNHAGGRAAGEIGGRIQRSSVPAYYALRLDRPRTLEEPLRCKGQFAVTQTMGSSSVYFGWFNTRTMEVRPRNFLGILVNGEGRGCEVHLSYNTSAGQSDGIRATGTGPRGAAVRDFNLIPVSTVYTFELVYDPSANGGRGEVAFTLGGKGPFTGGPFKVRVSADQRRSGGRFDAFGFVNPQATGNWLTMYVDDLELDYARPDDPKGDDPKRDAARPGVVRETFDGDPRWLAEGNQARFDDDGLEAAQRFGFSATSHAGGRLGELGGRISPAAPASYADKVGRLTLDDRLTASGKIALTQYGPDGAAYLGWFDSTKRGHPPANVLGVLIEGPTSTGPRFRGCVASSDARLSQIQRDTAVLLAPDGAKRAWKIQYDPEAESGRGRLTVWLDDRKDSFVLPEGLRKRRHVRPLRPLRPRQRGRSLVACLSG